MCLKMIDVWNFELRTPNGFHIPIYLFFTKFYHDALKWQMTFTNKGLKEKENGLVVNYFDNQHPQPLYIST